MHVLQCRALWIPEKVCRAVLCLVHLLLLGPTQDHSAQGFVAQHRKARAERSIAKDSADQTLPHLSPEVQKYSGSYSTSCDRKEQ